MKNIIFILLLFTPFLGLSQINKNQIRGNWKLDSIVTPKGVTLWGSVDYLLTISDTTLTYNKAINTCSAFYRITTGDSLKLIANGCTKMCCDEEKDYLSIYISYEGKLNFVGNGFTLKNFNGSYYFHKR
jgi:hypothetical protein